MSSLIVEVCRIEEIKAHPNADRLEVCRIKGWDVVVGKNQFKAGDKAVYFPPDCVLPTELSDRMGVTKYLGHLAKRSDGTRPPGGRVKTANLRGFKSYGTVMPSENPDWPVGHDVAEHYGVTKWEPPLRCTDGDAEKQHPAFHCYYDMENIRNFPDLFQPGEEVICTEKIHGQNARVGLIRDTDSEGRAVWRWMAGSHGVRRKKTADNAFWLCLTPEVKELLCDLSGCGYTPDDIDADPPVIDRPGLHNVVVFGERYGSGVQDMAYGYENGRFGFRAFDVTVDGRYLDFGVKTAAFDKRSVPTVPVIYRGPFSLDTVVALSEGDTTVCNLSVAGKFKGREGVVVLPVKERPVVTEKKVFERLQLKCISFSYMNRTDGTEDH